ncbi:MAG: hydroxymethylbilane synthase [Methylocystis sp.]
MTFPPSLRIGSRGSPLALAQTRMVQAALMRAHEGSDADFPIEVIRTTGDEIQDRPLSESGGKGLFTKELDSALIAGAIDLAVHSSKDLPTHLPSAIVIAGYLPREDARDAWIARGGLALDALPAGAVVGTASLRRAAQVKRRRPDIQTTLLRGNVETRLRKVETGEIDATLLAVAGLKRLGISDRATALLPLDEFPPACGQGAIGVTRRAGDDAMRDLLAPLFDEATGMALAAERAFLAALDGSCRTPIAGHAQVHGDELSFLGEVLRADGAEAYVVRRRGRAIDAALIGADAGKEILLRLPHGVAGLM